MDQTDQHVLKAAYDAAATTQEDACCGSGGCAACGDGPAQPAGGIVNEPFQAAVPDSYGLSCGDPVALAELAEGESVVNLGSGSGRDVFSAARLVGKRGKVIGVDFSASMLELAREREQAFREESGLANTEFREGNIADLPLFNASADAVIANCVINLCPDRIAVFREALRVLRPGGRLVLSDLVLEDDPGKAQLAGNTDASAVYATALSCEAYIEAVREAGFEDVQVLRLQRYRDGQACGDPVTSGIQELLLRSAASLSLSARRPL
ncbi:MAG: methyltransferase domain-containing protein [bacterium]